MALPPPTQQQMMPAAAERRSTARAAITTGQLRMHVAPMPTLGQTAPVLASNNIVKCKWWPVCKAPATECGGLQRQSCKYYGTRGTKLPPSELELQRQHRKHTWSESMLKRNCSYHPFCQRKMWDCGGTQRSLCTTFKPLGSTDPPSQVEWDNARKELKRQQVAAKRASAKEASSSRISEIV